MPQLTGEPAGAILLLERACAPGLQALGKRSSEGGSYMLYWALVFLVIAIAAAILGFGGIAGAATGIAKILFFIFLVVFIVSLIAGLFRRRRPPV